MRLPGQFNITLDNLEKLKISENLIGEGVESDPIVIDSIGASYSELRIKRTKSYILIKNLTIASIELKECENITIENCKIYDLMFIGASKNTVKNSEIYHGQLRYSRQNYFLQNSLQNGFSYITLSPEGVRGGNGVMKYKRNVYLGILLVVLAGVTVGVITLWDLRLLLFMILEIIPVIALFNLKRIRRRTRGLPPNIFKDNKSSYLLDLEEQFYDYRVY